MPPKKKKQKVEEEHSDEEQEQEEEESDEDYEVSYEEEEEDDDYNPEDDDDIPLVSRGRPRKASLGKRGKVAKKVESDEEEDEDYRPSKRARGRPKKVKTESETPTPKGRKKAEPKATPSKVVQSSKSSTDWNDIDLSSDAKTSNDSPWTHKFSSWNVNGIRAWLKGDGLEYITQECPDIFSIQETKCSEADLPESELEVSGYHTYWYSADQKGYSGTGLYCKEKPIDVKYGIGIDKHDNEGRVITAEFEKFYFVTAYVPNSGDKLQRLSYRVKEWDPDFRSYLQTLDKDKPVILCGDLNVAHNEIDIANPKSNQRSSGFTKEERESFTTLLTESSFIDSFRTLYPDKKDSYSYWSYRSNARANNKGWRLDYFVISERLKDKLCDSVIRTQVYGSDHCPIVLLLAL